MTISDFGTLFSWVLSFFSYRCRSQALAFLAAPLAHSKEGTVTAEPGRTWALLTAWHTEDSRESTDWIELGLISTGPLPSH